MKIDEMLRDAREAMGARTVYGEPIVRNGTTVVPAARVRGAGGGSGDSAGSASGGFAFSAKPAGAWVIRGDDVQWRPALDLNLVLRGGLIVVLLTVLKLRPLDR